MPFQPSATGYTASPSRSNAFCCTGVGRVTTVSASPSVASGRLVRTTYSPSVAASAAISALLRAPSTWANRDLGLEMPEMRAVIQHQDGHDLAVSQPCLWSALPGRLRSLSQQQRLPVWAKRLAKIHQNRVHFGNRSLPVRGPSAV